MRFQLWPLVCVLGCACVAPPANSDGGTPSASSSGEIPSSSAGASSGSSGGGSSGGPSSLGGTPAVLLTADADKILMWGHVVTPGGDFQGHVLVEGDLITCVDVDCSGQPGAATATVVDTQGYILPGMIDAHNHILFDIFDETDWAPERAYGNHDQWPGETRYHAMVDAKQYLNGEGASTWDFGCEMNKFGELKGLVAGTTSIVGAANPANRGCFGTLARTIDQTPNGLAEDKVQVATLFPSRSTADGVCANLASGRTDAYLIHIAEGVDATALAEWNDLGAVTTTPGCLYSPKTALVHGTALTEGELDAMAQHGMSLVWSPRSNVFLYGGGSDLSKTTNIPMALGKGIPVSLAPDWSMGGSQNLLDELRFADLVDNSVWGDVLSARQLFEMVTIRPAQAMGLGAVLGSVEVGKRADLVVLRPTTDNPYDSLLAAQPMDMDLVMVGGKILYGHPNLRATAWASPPCEDLDICGISRFACVAAPGGTTTNKFGQSLADITTALSTALTDYDALALTAYAFAPLTPLVRCP